MNSPDIRLAAKASARQAGDMAKKREPIDDMIDAHVWLRRRARKKSAQIVATIR
jgi:hypothetical protein